jgi:hypothetical protein
LWAKTAAADLPVVLLGTPLVSEQEGSLDAATTTGVAGSTTTSTVQPAAADQTAGQSSTRQQPSGRTVITQRLRINAPNSASGGGGSGGNGSHAGPSR